MKQNPYPSILHTAQKSAFRQRRIGGSLLRTAFAVLLLASAAACSDDNSNDIPGDGNDDTGNATNLITVRFGSGGDDATPEARTTIGSNGKTVLWSTDDRIGISAVRTDNTDPNMKNVTNKEYKPATAAANSAFKPIKDGEMQLDDGGTYTFTSYYPYKYSATTDKVSGVSVGTTLQKDGIGKQDFMWAQETGIEISGTEPQVSFKYKHVFPMLVFNIENAEGKKVKVISVRSANGTTSVRGTVDVSLTNGTTGEVRSGKYYTTLTFTTPMGEDDTGRLLILPQAAGAKLIIGVLTTDNVVYEYTKTAGANLEGGKSHAFTFNLAEGTVTNRTVYTAGGTTDNWQIADESGLRAFALAVNYYGQTRANATLTANVTLSAYTAWEEPIGMGSDSYEGIFDGGGKTVSDLAINRTSNAPYVGLFGHLYNATIQNLRVTGTVTAGASVYVGGIAGYTESSSVIKNCLFDGNIEGYNSVGGIVGYNTGSEITACFSSGTMTAKNNSVGGIVGYNNNKGTITHCYSSATMTTEKGSAGGIVGGNASGSTVSSCYATGTVSATDKAGGIVGSNSAKLEKSLALGSAVIKTGTDNSTDFGRVAGQNSGSGSITNCAAWDSMTLPDDITATNNGDGKDGASLTTVDCKKKVTYTDARGFDPTVWEFDGDPSLQTYLPWNTNLVNYWKEAAKLPVPGGN